jgi:hypothetical protein
MSDGINALSAILVAAHDALGAALPVRPIGLRWRPE